MGRTHRGKSPPQLFSEFVGPELYIPGYSQATGGPRLPTLTPAQALAAGSSGDLNNLE